MIELKKVELTVEYDIVVYPLRQSDFLTRYTVLVGLSLEQAYSYQLNDFHVLIPMLRNRLGTQVLKTSRYIWAIEANIKAKGDTNET